MVGGSHHILPVLLRDDNKHDENQDAHGPKHKSQSEWDGRV